MLKYINQQLACHNTIHFNTCSDILLKHHILLNYNKGTCLNCTHLIHSTQDFINCLGTVPLSSVGVPNTQEAKPHSLSSQLFQSSSKFWLEDNNQCNNAHTDGLTRNPEYSSKIKKICHNSKSNNNNNTF